MPRAVLAITQARRRLRKAGAASPHQHQGHATAVTKSDGPCHADCFFFAILRTGSRGHTLLKGIGHAVEKGRLKASLNGTASELTSLAKEGLNVQREQRGSQRLRRCFPSTYVDDGDDDDDYCSQCNDMMPVQIT
jgi:hypothetical protein